MATITLKIDGKSKAGKTLKELIAIFSKEPGVEIVSEKSPYDPAFIKKIKKSEQQINEGKFKTLNTNDIWGSLGL